MGDIHILTLDKIGRALRIDPNSGNLDIYLSDDPRNALKIGPDNKLVVNGLFVEDIPRENAIVWTGVNITDPNLQAGMADLSNPLQVGKDVLGNIWMRGAVTNKGGALAANSIVAIIPSDFSVSNYAEDYGFFQMGAIQSSLAGNTTALFLRMQNYNYQQSLAFSGSMATNVSFVMQPTIIGKAKYSFPSAPIAENMPSYMDVTWESVVVSNANVVTGMADASNPLQIGKDALGNIWMRGAVTNVGAAVAANGVIGTIPVDLQLSGYLNATTFCQLTAVQSSLAGNTTALFLRLKNYTGVQSLAFSASLASGVSFMLQPTIIGRALK